MVMVMMMMGLTVKQRQHLQQKPSASQGHLPLYSDQRPPAHVTRKTTSQKHNHTQRRCCFYLQSSRGAQ